MPVGATIGTSGVVFAATDRPVLDPKGRVAFSLRDRFTILSELQVPVERIRLSGGARSPLWRQIQADVYGHSVETVGTEEGAAFGAALLAEGGAGIWKTVEEACGAVVRVKESVEIEPEAAGLMNERYREYRRLYPPLHGIYTEHPHVSI